MRFVIKLLPLFITAKIFASPIQIFYEDRPSQAQIVKDIFTNNYSIPEELISLEEVKSCEGLRNKGKLDVCLNNNGDLLVVSVDRGFISESLKIFQAP